MITSLHTLQRVMVSYQWCMVGYASNLALTIIKVIFEKNRVRVYPCAVCVVYSHALCGALHACTHCTVCPMYACIVWCPPCMHALFGLLHIPAMRPAFTICAVQNDPGLIVGLLHS